MPPLSAPSRNGVQQCHLYACRNLAAIASTNVWYHFTKRVLAHVRRSFSLPEDEFNALSTEQRRKRRLHLMQAAADICRAPIDSRQAPDHLRDWIDHERDRLQIDAAVGEWDGKPLKWHLKAQPHRFVRAMATMADQSERSGGKSFSLYPLRRTHIPRHARFDEKALRDLLGFGANEYHKKKRRRVVSDDMDTEEWNLPPLTASIDDLMPSDVTDVDLPSRGTLKRVRRKKEELKDEKWTFFRRIVDFRGAKIRQPYGPFQFPIHHRWRYDASRHDQKCAKKDIKTPGHTNQRQVVH